MARREIAAGGALLILALSASLLAEETPKPQTGPPPAQTQSNASRKESDPLVQLVRSLTPEQKTRLIESIKTWQELTPEAKQALRAREKSLKKAVTDEIGAALEGLELTPEQRTAFEKRFKEERRKLDMSLRTELDTRRKAGLQEIILKIKKELALPSE